MKSKDFLIVQTTSLGDSRFGLVSPTTITVTMDRAREKLNFQSTVQITGEIFPVLSIQKMSPQAEIKHTGASCCLARCKSRLKRMVIHLKWSCINQPISPNISEVHKQLRSSFPTYYNPNRSLSFSLTLLSLLNKECSLANPWHCNDYLLTAVPF